MKKIYLFITLFLLFNLLFSQNIDPKKLNEQISILNNEQKYEESIVLLDEIINNNHSNADAIYNAFLQKALTYKRVFNYTEVLINLEAAKKWGEKSSQKKVALSRIKIEELFINFDMLKFDEVDRLVVEITDNDIHYLDQQSKAFYIGLLGVNDIRNKNYLEAEKKFNESIQILEQHSPKDLPNIYRKKIALYGHLNNEEKALEAYKLGVDYADKYNIGVYKIGIHDAMSKFYFDREDYKSAYHYHLIQVEEYNRYNVNIANDNLKVMERELLNKRKDLEINYEKNLRIFMVVIVVILLAFLLVLLQLFKVNRQKQRLMVRENLRMREELASFSKELNDKGESKLNPNQFNLTQRQIEIIELVKQGKTNKEIGVALFISENTVKYHLKIIYNVLGIENRYDL